MLASAGADAGEPVKLAFINQTPLTVEANGQRIGAGFAVIEEMMAGLPVGPLQLVPGKRLTYDMARIPLIAVNLTRTREREALDGIWIGEICSDEFVFATLAGGKPIASYDEARALPHIGVTSGGNAESLLHSKDFGNLDNVGDSHSQAAKLHTGRIDSWFNVRGPMTRAWQEMGFDPAELSFGPTIERAGIWIVASNQVDPELVAELRRRYEALTPAKRQALCRKPG